MKRCTYPDSSIHEVVVLENIFRERVLRGVFREMTVVLYRILPTDVIDHICNMAYPLARSAHLGEGQGVFWIEYNTHKPATTFYRV